ncbi:MAG: hypothetical protein Q9170_002248 [Blastenia crenularia]
MATVTSTWHHHFIDYNSLDFKEYVKVNISEACHPKLGDVIVKYARFEWDISYYQAETEAYHWIEGHDIGPHFLGHLTEEGRIIDFLLETIEGHHAGPEDLSRCEEVVQKLHSLGIVHRDPNRYNFIVNESRVTLIDFETARKTQDEDELAQEMKILPEKLIDSSGKGGRGMVWPDNIQLEMDEIYRRDGGWSDQLTQQADEGEITMTSEENKRLVEEVRAGRTAYVPV